MYGDNIAAAPVSYVVSYFGENITNGSVTVDVTRAAIDLPAVDSDVNVFVTAMNVFGTGGNGEVSVDYISELTTYVHICTYICCQFGYILVCSFYNCRICNWLRVITITQISTYNYKSITYYVCTYVVQI